MSLTQVALDQESLAMLDASAMLRSLSREDALRAAVYSLSEYDRWFQSMVEKGRAAVARGEIVTQDDIEAEDISLRQEITLRGE